MNLSASECSSGCESGWTMYLDQSSISADQFRKSKGRINVKEGFIRSENLEGIHEDHDDEGLSMVSDASSGPPHFPEDEGHNCFHETGYFYYGSSHEQAANERETKKSKTKEQRGKQQHHSYLDDTASSSVHSFSKKQIGGGSIEHALGFSTTQLKGKKSALQKHFGFFQSSVSGNPASGE